MPDADDELLDDDQRLIAEAVRDVCSGFDDDYWARVRPRARVPVGLLRADGRGRLGRHRACPRSTAAAAAASPRPRSCCTRSPRSGAAMNGCSALHLTIFGLNPVVKFGNDRLKDDVPARAPPPATSTSRSASPSPTPAPTPARITTRAEPDGNGGWRDHRPQDLDDEGARVARWCCCSRAPATTDSGLRGLSLFLADLDPDYVDIRPIPKVGRNAVASCEVAYDGLPVEGWRLVGDGGRGLPPPPARPQPRARAARVARRAASARSRSTGPSAYAKERDRLRPADRRQPGDQPPARPGPHAAAAAWMMALHAGRRYDAGLDCGEAANSAKYLAAEAGVLRRRPRRADPRRHGLRAPSTTWSATGARPACSASRRSPRR